MQLAGRGETIMTPCRLRRLGQVGTGKTVPITVQNTKCRKACLKSFCPDPYPALDAQWVPVDSLSFPLCVAAGKRGYEDPPASFSTSTML
jgi:hypothetical protein